MVSGNAMNKKPSSIIIRHNATAVGPGTCPESLGSASASAAAESGAIRWAPARGPNAAGGARPARNRSSLRSCVRKAARSAGCSAAHRTRSSCPPGLGRCLTARPRGSPTQRARLHCRRRWRDADAVLTQRCLRR
eukprot:361221-Chlamydomonas_euryale.AAC.8